MKGPGEFFYYLNRGSLGSTAAQDFGTSFHEMVLEDAPLPITRKHTKTTLEHLQHMKRRVYQSFPILSESHPENGTIKRELAGFCVHEQTGCSMKFKADILMPFKKTLVDLKTTTDATPENFKWSAKRYNYHLQAAHYLDCANRIDGAGSYDSFLFIAVEKTYPYKVFLHQCSDHLLQMGLNLRDEYLEKAADWKANQNTTLMELLYEEQDKIYIMDW